MHIYSLSNSEKYDPLNYLNVWQEKYRELLKELEKETMEKLEGMVGDNILLLFEAHRFMCYLVFFQSKIIYEWAEYYENILKFFHKNNLLIWKENVQHYKHNFRKKRVYKIVVFNTVDLHFIKKYHFRYELINDLGRSVEDVKEEVFEFSI